MFTNAGGDRADVPNVAIIITDGTPTIDIQQTLPEAAGARAEGVTMFVIGIGGDTNDKFLESLAGGALKRVFKVDDFDALPSIADTILSHICRAVTCE